MQLLLYAAGGFTTTQETHLFTAFLGRMEETWERFEGRAARHRNVGLPAIMSRSQFDELMRDVALRVLGDIGRRNPAAPWILEKTPENVLHWQLIVRLLPRARFITVIRDPRAVVASTIAARTWAGEWAHRDVAQITDGWIRAVNACLALEAAHPHVTRIRFERMRAQTCNVLAGVLTKFQIRLTAEKLAKVVDSVSLEALREGRFKAPWPLENEPDNFFRSGSVSAWRDELPIATIAQIEHLAKDEMRILGYSPVARIEGSSSD